MRHYFLQAFLYVIRIPYLLRAFLLRCFYCKSRMVIAVNMEGFGSVKTRDIGDYVEPLLREWGRYVRWNVLRLYSTKYNYYTLARALPLACRLDHQLLEREEDILCLEESPDLLFCPYGKITPLVPRHRIVCQLFDRADLFFPEFFSLEDLSACRNHDRTMCAFTDHLIVPSAFSKKAMATFLQLPEDRVSVVPLPVADLPKRGVRPQLVEGFEFSFIYYPAENTLHKNHRHLFLAIAELIRTGWKGGLICSGERKASGIDLLLLAQEIGIADRFLDLKKVSPAEASWLYQEAIMLIFPSFFESYGKSIIEAFQMGLPVVCSGVTALPEVAGEAALYCNPFDIHDIGQKIEQLWNDRTLRLKLSAQGRERRKLLSNKSIVRKYAQVFHQLIQRPLSKSISLEKQSLPPINLNKMKVLYQENACINVTDDISLRARWFSNDHGESFDIKKIPSVEKSDLTFWKKENLLPIHFLTIVYNGMPFIERHLAIFKELPCQWHWHIVEGAAELKGDTAWSLAQGGKLPEQTDVLSNDGTSEYLDIIAQQFPENITIYRQERRWEGKREMISAPIKNFPDDILLWEIDVDEYWSFDQIMRLNRQFIQEPTRTAAAFYCRFFVGPNRVADNLGAYGNNAKQEWRRVWRYRMGDTWASHEPPALRRFYEDGTSQDVMDIYPFSHQETWRMGLVFDHFAFVRKQQLQFKEEYYGYRGAVAAFQAMAEDPASELLVKKYYSWVKDPIWAFIVKAHSYSDACECISVL